MFLCLYLCMSVFVSMCFFCVFVSDSGMDAQVASKCHGVSWDILKYVMVYVTVYHGMTKNTFGVSKMCYDTLKTCHARLFQSVPMCH